jgi:hypothetical protein
MFSRSILNTKTQMKQKGKDCGKDRIMCVSDILQITLEDMHMEGATAMGDYGDIDELYPFCII